MVNYSQSQSNSRGEDSAASKDAGQLDSTGQAILKLLHRAAGAAEANSRQGLETAQRLSSQLHAAQGRIAELESELQLNRPGNTAPCGCPSLAAILQRTGSATFERSGTWSIGATPLRVASRALTAPSKAPSKSAGA